METLSLRFTFMHTRTMSRTQREYGSVSTASDLSTIDRVKKEMGKMRLAEAVRGGDFQPDHYEG
jgi:hypothetical protein